MPGALAAQLIATIQGLGRLANIPGNIMAMYRSLFGHGRDAIKPSGQLSPARQQLQDNRSAVDDLVRQAAVISAAEASAGWEYASSTDAQAVRDELSDQIDQEAETASDATYGALMDLRAAVVRDLTDRAMQLPRLVRVTPVRTLPALVIAHQIYGDAGRAEEIVARNRIRHPLAVPGGQALEVLADG